MPAAKVYQGVVVANAFNFFVSAGQACLIPFLSLYFLYLDLSSFQTGLLLGIKALTGVLSSAFWTQCVTTTSKRLKGVLIFSLLTLVMTHLVMVLMPSMKDKPKDFCSSGNDFESIECFGNQSNCSSTKHLLTSLGLFSHPFTENDSTTSKTTTTATTTATTATPNTTIPSDITSTHAANATALLQNEPSDANVGRPAAVATTTTTTSIKHQNDDTADGVQGDSDDNWSESDKTDYIEYPRKSRHADHEDPIPEEAEKKKETTDGIRSGIDPPPSKNSDGRSSEELKARLENIQNQVFSAMLVLVVVSELFCSPFEQVADELYVSFLECHGLPLSRRRTTKCWSLLAKSIMPWIVVIAVDRLPCFLPPFGSHRILFHFWLFAFVHLLSFLFSLCHPTSVTYPPDAARATPAAGASSLPQPPPGDHYHHSRRWANLKRGAKLLVADGRAVLATLTIFFVGLMQGVICTFLPWVIHSLVKDGSEFYIGAAIGLAATGDLLARFVGEWICRKLGHAVTIVFGLVIMATRLALYGYLPKLKPWMALIGESAHLLGGALISVAVVTHPAFRASTGTRGAAAADGEAEGGHSKKRKNARGYGSLASFAASEAMSLDSSLFLIRSGLGFSAGCCAAGLISAHHGLPMAFWAAAGAAVVWCLTFALLYPCCRSRCLAGGSAAGARKRSKSSGLASSLLAGRYKRLSRREDDQEEDEEEEEEEEEDEDDDDEYDEDGGGQEMKSDWMDSVLRKHT